MTRRLTGIPRKRIATHGDFATSARISQAILEALCDGYLPALNRLSPAHREALRMIAFKMARIVAGDPDHVDHWIDIAGYGQLGRAACQRKRRARS